MKRLFDLIVSIVGLIFSAPLLIIVSILVWFQDFKSPFYIPYRIGKNGKQFKMIKFRSMIVNADSSGIDSTSSNDTRITYIGHLIRKFKLDELTQLWNVMRGDMSLVGPRPNVKNETDLYTETEKKLLNVKPGITDISSIVFSDEGEILADKRDPDIAYNQLIRPWKSRLGLIYIENQSVVLDIKLLILTVLAIFSRTTALEIISKLLAKYNVDEKIIKVVRRQEKLVPYPPPGADKIVVSR